MMSLFKKNKTVEILAPMSGKIIPLEEVGDNIFATKGLGDGIAIEITDGKVVAPFDGEITSTYKSKHCVVIRSEEGLELLIHVGLETIKLQKEGFVQRVVLMERVKKGDVILEADLDILKEKEKSIISPIVILNMGKVESIEKAEGIAEKGVTNIMTITMKKGNY